MPTPSILPFLIQAIALCLSAFFFYFPLATTSHAQTDISNTQHPQKPHVTLAKTYQAHHGIDLSGYWASEKLDGVRGYWTGNVMLTKQGNEIQLPMALLNQLPQVALDGELWIDRESFSLVSSLIRKNHTTLDQWKNNDYAVSYQVFDMPTQGGPFTARLKTLNKLYKQSLPNNTFWTPIKQFKVHTHTQLMENLTRVEALGGEGLMLHKGSSHYHSHRNNDLLKVKSFNDAEAIVTGHIKGKGKYQGLMGSIKVKTKAGIHFKIGTGFSDAERKDPPPIGSLITYKFYGKTHKGTPKFASFLRIRHPANAVKTTADKITVPSPIKQQNSK